MNDSSGIAFGDMIGLISLYIGLQNLQLNIDQVDGVMKELRENQNAMLATIIEQNVEIIKQNEDIIKRLEEERNAHKTN